MVAAVATFAAISCTQELDNNVPEQTGETVVFTAYADGADTKTELDGTQSLWTSGDRIWILNGKEGDTSWKKAYATTDSGSKAIFTEEDNSYPLEGTQYFAVYPAGAAENATWEGGDVMGVTLSSNQIATPGSYDPAAHIAVAKSETTSLSFKNAVSLLKFRVKNEGVKSVTIYTNSGKLTGSCNISADGIVTPWTGEGESANWVKLSAGDGTFELEKDYFISVFPTTIKDFTVQFSFGGSNLDVKTYSTDKPEGLTLNRSGILNLGELEYVVPEVVLPEFEAWTGYVYLQPNTNWKADNARFVAYFFGNGETWVDMTLVDGTEDIYGCKIPEGFANVIFCRMNPATEENNWDNKWNQTNDLTIEGVVYTVAEGAWDNGAGTWTTVETTEPPTEPVEPEIPSVTPGEATEWALVGVFSSWADKTMLTTEDANVVVLKNVAMKAAEGFLVRKPSTDWADKYGAGDINYLKANHYITTSKDGADMCLEADGTYDIYFNISTKVIYVMNADTDYTTAIEQTASGKEPVQEEPEVTEKVVYLKPNSNWTQSNARFAAYFFGGTTGEKWVSMTAVGDGTYEVHLPEGYDYGCNIIFCRMNPSTTANNWNNKWNQTSDLKTPTDGKNLYTVKAGTWDKGGGTWSTKQ